MIGLGMTENEVNFCFQGHDENLEHLELNINNYLKGIICLKKKK